MVPCLHQRIAYIKRKLRVWRDQKCNFLVRAKTAPACTGLQTTPFHASPYKAENGNFGKVGATYRHGTVFASRHCLYQKETTRIESPKMQFCDDGKTVQTSTGLQATPFLPSPYKADNGNLRKFGSTYRHGTVKHCLYQKEGTGIESPKM